MGCNASNQPPHNNNPNVRSSTTSYSIFRRCRRRKKNKEEQNDEYNDEELKRKIDMVSGVTDGAGGGGDTNKDINLSHHGFNFLGNSFNKFKGGGGNNGQSEFYEDGDQQDDLNNKNRQVGAGGNAGGGAGGNGIFSNVPLLAQSQASSSQIDFFRMLDQKIQEGPDYQTPSPSCCSSDQELDEGDSGTWTKMRESKATKNHNHNHNHHHHYQLLHHEAKNRWKPFSSSSASVDKTPPGYHAVNCIIESNTSRTSSSSGGAVAVSLMASGTTPTPTSSPHVGGGKGGGGACGPIGAANRTNPNIISGISGGVGGGSSSSSGGGGAIGFSIGRTSNTNNNLGNATVITNNSALKDYYMNDRGLRGSPHLPHRDSQC